MYVDLSFGGKIIKKLINIDVKGDILANIIATVLWRSEFFFFFSDQANAQSWEKLSGRIRKRNNEK